MILIWRKMRSSSGRSSYAASEIALYPKWISMSRVLIFIWSVSLARRFSSTVHSEPSTSILTCVERGPLPFNSFAKVL